MTGAWALFRDGAAAPLTNPWILLCLLPLGVLIGLSARAGVRLPLAALAAGLAAGVAAAPYLPPGLALAPLAVGLAAALLAALDLAYPPAAIATLAGLAGVASGGFSLSGFGRLPLLIHAGVAAGALLAALLPALAVCASRRLTDAPWLTIAWRVVASWLGAVAIMLGALLLSRP